MPRAALLALALLGTALPAAASNLFGVTASDTAGNVDFVSIDTGSGAASPLFSFNIGAGNQAGTLAYHRPTGLFLMLPGIAAAAGLNVTLGKIDPVAQTYDPVALTGLTGNPDASGIAYDAANDRILISFADDGESFAEDNVAQIGLDGAALNEALGVAADLDGLAFRATTGDVLGWDPNSGVANERLVIIDGLFGAPTTSPLGPPPSNNDVGDVSVDPDTGILFTTFFDSSGGRLYRLDGDTTYVDLGAYNASRQVVGLAFVPEPGVLLLALVAGVAALRARR